VAAHAALPDLHQDERLCTCAGCPGDRLRNHVSRLFGVDDAIADGDIAYSIVLKPAVSTDATYNGKVGPQVSITNVDNEPAE